MCIQINEICTLGVIIIAVSDGLSTKSLAGLVITKLLVGFMGYCLYKATQTRFCSNSCEYS